MCVHAAKLLSLMLDVSSTSQASFGTVQKALHELSMTPCYVSAVQTSTRTQLTQDFLAAGQKQFHQAQLACSKAQGHLSLACACTQSVFTGPVPRHWAFSPGGAASFTHMLPS